MLLAMVSSFNFLKMILADVNKDARGFKLYVFSLFWLIDIHFFDYAIIPSSPNKST